MVKELVAYYDTLYKKNVLPFVQALSSKIGGKGLEAAGAATLSEEEISQLLFYHVLTQFMNGHQDCTPPEKQTLAISEASSKLQEIFTAIESKLATLTEKLNKEQKKRELAQLIESVPEVDLLTAVIDLVQTQTLQANYVPEKIRQLIMEEHMMNSTQLEKLVFEEIELRLLEMEVAWNSGNIRQFKQIHDGTIACLRKSKRKLHRFELRIQTQISRYIAEAKKMGQRIVERIKSRGV